MNNSQSELSSFHQFVSEKLGSTSGISPEEALDLWRSMHQPAGETEETIAALREAIAQMNAGDVGVPIEEFDRQFRAKRNLGID
jgi:hypothetical protein